MEDKYSRMTIDITQSDHKKLKATASLMGLSMKKLVTTIVEEFLNKNMEVLVRQSIHLETKEDAPQ